MILAKTNDLKECSNSRLPPTFPLCPPPSLYPQQLFLNFSYRKISSQVVVLLKVFSQWVQQGETAVILSAVVFILLNGEQTDHMVLTPPYLQLLLQLSSLLMPVTAVGRRSKPSYLLQRLLLHRRGNRSYPQVGDASHQLETLGADSETRATSGGERSYRKRGTEYIQGVVREMR